MFRCRYRLWSNYAGAGTQLVAQAFDIKIHESLEFSYLLLMLVFKGIPWSIEYVSNPIMA